MTASQASSPVVVITGCSSGIGRAAALHFARKGWRVYASMRGSMRGADLLAEARAAGWALTAPELDVTSDASVATAMGAILEETGGRIDVLVNNAGYYLWGPVEETSPDELRAQLETNVVGVVRVTRAVLPAMRARGEGAIVNIGSVSGRVALPAVGPYHASKWAIEGLTESLRYELIPFGIRVALVEPGAFKSELHVKEVQAASSREERSPYAFLTKAYTRRHAWIPRADLDAVVDVIYRAATAPDPKLRWPVGPTSILGTLGRRLTPDRLYEWLIRIAFGLRRGARRGGGPDQLH